jgi:hypothetical protein
MVKNYLTNVTPNKASEVKSERCYFMRPPNPRNEDILFIKEGKHLGNIITNSFAGSQMRD